MSYTKCAYHNCNKTNQDKSMFRFPVNDQDRLIIWIRNSGNIFLDSLTNEELSRRYICADHFPSSSIHKELERSRLIGPAVPVHFKHPEDLLSSPEVLKVKTPTKFYRIRRNETSIEELQSSPRSTMSLEVPMTTPTRRLSRKCLFEGPQKRLSRKCLFQANDTDTPKTKRLKSCASNLLKKNKSQEAHIRRLKSKLSGAKMSTGETFRSKISRTVSNMQKRKKGDKKKWSSEEKNFCLTLFYKSPSTYYFLRRQGVVLATPSTIRTWLSKSNCSPGLNKETFRQLEKKFHESSFKDKACVVCFDEMSIMADLEYSKKYDLIEGFEDLGEGRRTKNMAKYALVFIVRGLYKNWKVPVSYYLSHTNVKAENLELIIKITINKLFKHGLLPKAIVCDQMSTNQKVYKNLGANPEYPFFYCNGRKIFTLFDVPHLLKNIRNNLLTNDYVNDENKISFQDIIKTYEIDKKSTKSRALHKITDRHISPNSFQKMNVSLAAQIFSNAVAAAIRTVKRTGELNSETAQATANFVQVVNNMFDALNSKNIYDKNPYRHALSDHSNYARSAIIDGINVFRTIKKKSIKNDKRGQSKINLTRPPFFDGMVQSCQAVLQLFDEERTDKSIKFLITNKLNQDVLENLFARFRQKGGSNRNPTAKLLRTIFRSNFINSLIKLPSTKNCEDENDKFIDIKVGLSPINKTEQANEMLPSSEEVASLDGSYSFASSKHGSESIVYSSVEQIIPTCSTTQNVVTLQDCSVSYFAGYLAKSCIDKFHCTICVEKLTKENDLEDKNQLLILLKSYSFNKNIKLKMPSDNFYKLVNLALHYFTVLFQDMAHYKDLKCRLFKAISKFLSCEAQYLMETFCENHIKFIIDRMITVKIYFYCKTQKKGTNVQHNHAHPKLRILNNK